MTTTPPPGDNPQGLATFEPMGHPKYRAAARTFLDGYLERRGLAPCEWPEDTPPADQADEVAEEEPEIPSPYARVG